MDLRMPLRARALDETQPVRTGTVFTSDGERISVAFDRAIDVDFDPATKGSLCFVVAHGFTGSWRLRDNRRIARALSAYGNVVSFDLRGHGSSSGKSTVGDAEILDLNAAIDWARWCGAGPIVTVGFSLGGSVVLRQAAHADAEHHPDAVVSVSSPGFWFYRGTDRMRLLHVAVENPLGRAALRYAFDTRVTTNMWQDPFPTSPSEVAAMIAPTPLLVVHGGQDAFLPIEHGETIATAARDGARDRGVADHTDEWMLEDFGHAESATSTEIAARLGAWGVAACGGVPVLKLGNVGNTDLTRMREQSTPAAGWSQT
ncbi:MAG: alpha/beta fold hydrolase [Actinomycetes bacterium]